MTTNLEPGPLDDGDLIRLHNLDQRRRNLAGASILRRSHLLRHFSAYLARPNGEAGLLNADTETVQAFLDTLPLKAKTRYDYISNLHSFYRWAIQAGHTRFDPTADIDRPKFPPGQPRPIDNDDLEVALELADRATAVMLACAAYAGMRCCEIARMSRDDLRPGDKPLLSVHGKGTRSRLVPLHPNLAAALDRHGMPRTGPVLRRQDGRPVTAWLVSQTVNKYLHSLGIKATAHQLRHWFGTAVYKTSNHNLLLVADLMGHASVTTTQIYAAFDREGAWEAVAALAV
jgi:site-specific recombinase XerD